ncbi:MAG: hypothetical protein GXP55_12300, partial [Deltaproteobacteria bacterium]|nr:hypothetical protein [Deltaproteobacteria bacterium]
MRRRLLLLALPCLAALACHPCDSVGELRVAGDSSYVRCAALDAPDEGERRVGDVAFEIEGRTLRFTSPPTRVAFFRGPAPRSADLEGSLSALVERGTGLFVMLGGAGDDEALAQRSLRALAATERPALVLAGGRDEAEVLSDAFEALGDEAPGVVDARGLRVVRLGATSLLLLSGAPGGRYARTDDACGFGPDDLEALREA